MGYTKATRTKIQKIQLEAYRHIARAISYEDINEFYEVLTDQVLNISNADGMSIYSLENNALTFRIMKTRSFNFHLGGTSGKKIDFPPQSLFNDNGSENHAAMSTHVALTAKPLVIDDCYDSDEFDFSGAKKFDSQNGYRTKAMVTIPIIDYTDTVQGVMQIINPMDFESGSLIVFNDDIIADLQNFNRHVGSYISQKRLLVEVENMFEALILLIARAIDKKSHYTGKHCERVPILTKMISEQLCAQTDGYYKEFDLTDDEKNELRIAAWLHDTGKIATPPHINDKATKLERIIDGIELVEHRLEILKKDAEIAFLKDKIVSIERDKSDIPRLEARYNKRLSEINEYLDLVSELNVGGEDLSNEKIDQIYSAHREKLVVSDKNIHLLDEYERSALSIRRGTLDNSERSTINEHVSITRELLDEIPFPENLKNVPEIAANHHEKLDGTGYPLAKGQDDLSVQSRILAFSDIFEALTAPDRPYKKANTLSESLDIMYNMCESGKIDKEIFKIFVSSGLYEKYAKEHIDKSQIDEIDLLRYTFS